MYSKSHCLINMENYLILKQKRNYAKIKQEHDINKNLQTLKTLNGISIIFLKNILGDNYWWTFSIVTCVGAHFCFEVYHQGHLDRKQYRNH